MNTPIFLIEKGDVVVFDSTETAEAYVEPIDVINDEYVFYDAEGRLLSAAVIDNHVKLSQIDLEPKHAIELATILKRYLKAVREPGEVDEGHDLPVLVAAFGEFVLDFRGQPTKRR